jgi:ABC-2 type transport system permease protein
VTAFLRQLRWELRKLWRRPRTYVGFAAALLFELVVLSLLRLPAARDEFVQRVWRLHERFGIREPFSGLSNAVEVAGQTMLFIGGVSLAFVAAELVAKEAEDGTLRMVFCRPVSRTSVLLQKLITCAIYTATLTLFVGATALLLGMLLEKPGQLVVVSVRESIVGVHELAPALARYAAAIPLLATSVFTVALLAFTLSCFPLRAATAAAVAIIVLLADWIIQTHPGLVAVSPYTLMTRISSWRQVFNETVPWPRLERNYSQLAMLDGALIVIAWWAFRRRPLTPR